MSSRVRLARNLADFPFISRATAQDRAAIEKILHERTWRLPAKPTCCTSTSRSWRRSTASSSSSGTSSAGSTPRVKAPAPWPSTASEKFSLMINEEDHLRIQVIQSGLDLGSVWEQINRIDDLIEQKVTYAFHERLGYLTACPTNVGTGMRVSVMLHLPALVITRQIDKVFRSLQKISLAVRGLYGEGSQAMGDFYQISNQVTLGRTESELLRQVSDIVPVIIDYERQARDFLIKESHENLHDRVSRAYGILRTAQTISSEETMHLLSSVRMGVNLGLIRDLNIPTINELFIRTQPAHLQKLTGGELDTADRNIERARYLRRHLNDDNNGGAEKN